MEKTWISFAPIKQLVGAVSERTGGKSGFYNVPLPIWAFLHFVSTDHLGTLINFGKKGSGGTVSESFCKFSYAEPL